jgi:hypothetical protein
MKNMPYLWSLLQRMLYSSIFLSRFSLTFAKNSHGFPQYSILKHPQSTFLRKVRDQISHPYRTTSKIVILHIPIFTFFKKVDDKTKIMDWIMQTLPEFNFLLISSWIKFWFVTFVPKYLNCATFWSDLFYYFYTTILNWILVTRQYHVLSFSLSLLLDQTGW